MTENPTYKNGIKTLTETQLKNGLPNYDLLKKKLQIIREHAGQMPDGVVIDGSYENLKYDNIISILGGRGAGKTSILLTIYHELEKDTDNINILMPLIMPELIDNSDSFIGWILSAVEKNLQDIEKKIKECGYRSDQSYYEQMCDKYHFFDRCVFNNNNDLRKTFEELKKSYYARIYNARRGEWDLSSDMALVSSINDKGFSLIEQFTKYWNKLVDTYRGYYKKKYDIIKTPLIFFMIDDADLKPQIINELIFSLPKYFSHPNVIVFISASQKTLNFTVKNFMYHQVTKREFDLTELMRVEYYYNFEPYTFPKSQSPDPRQMVKFHELRYGKEYDKIITLTEEILRKLFPVSNRFYLKKYDKYEEKCKLKFEYSDKKVVDISVQFAKQLKQFEKNVTLLHQNSINSKMANDDMSSRMMKKKQKEINSKLNTIQLIDSINCDISSPIYLSFLGKYPRDIVSSYYAFSDMLDEILESLKKFYSENSDYVFGQPVSNELINSIHNSCITFINSVIASNKKLKLFCKHSDDMIFERKMHWQLFVNYPMVVEMLCKPEYYEENKMNPAPFVEMLCLLNFIEQLIVFVMPDRKSSHGHTEFYQIMKKCGIDIVKPSNNLDLMLKQYEMYNALKVIPDFDKSKLEHQDAVLDVVNKLGLLNTSNTNMDEIANQKWYDFVYEIMYYRFSDISKIKKLSKHLFVLESPSFVDEYYIKTYNQYYDLLKKWYSSEKHSSQMSIRVAYDLVEQMDSTILSLRNALNSITISFIDYNTTLNYLESFANEIDDVYIYSSLRMAMKSFIDVFVKNKGNLNRLYLVNALRSFYSLMPKSENMLSFASWHRRLTRILEDSATITIDDEYYYWVLCDFIIDNAQGYLDAVTALSLKNFSTSKTMKSVEEMRTIYENLPNDQYAKQYIKNLHEREWDNLMEME